ncbi:STAS domain-containing protein [Marinomonas balearica]|uniref:Anti-anti-sigma factor n=1 Tax=Marinomonas balearica TaxID=491947 RepID=A0A4R6MH61_9GAMM|nr:STAS domain-containing protein [Marinomonas balearica]TDP01074.1 anti-anti-sigma factor [Marinomonas balearica]
MYQNHYTLNAYEVLELAGEMDCVAVAESKDILEKIPQDFAGDIVFDLSKVTFIDSSGIGAIVFLFKRLREEERALLITGLNGQPKELMTLLRINRAITIKDDVRSCAVS